MVAAAANDDNTTNSSDNNNNVLIAMISVGTVLRAFSTLTHLIPTTLGGRKQNSPLQMGTLRH